MNLEQLRIQLNIPRDVPIVDAESFVLSLLLRDNTLGYAVNERCLIDYQNALVDYMLKRKTPVYFTFLSEENNRKIEEKALGLYCDEKIKLSELELDALAMQAKQSPCLNVHRDGEGYSYQIDHSVLEEIENPSIYNGAITEWSGNPYYIYLVYQVAKDHTVDAKTRRKINDCGEEFSQDDFVINQRNYVESYIITEENRVNPNNEERTHAERQVVGFYEMLKKAAHNPAPVLSGKVQDPDEQ